MKTLSSKDSKQEQEKEMAEQARTYNDLQDQEHGRRANELLSAEQVEIGSKSWERIAKKIRAELGDDLYSSWFKRLEPEYAQSGTLYASVPTRFLRNWLNSHYAATLLRVCQSELDGVKSVNVIMRTRGLPTCKADLSDSQGTGLLNAANTNEISHNNGGKVGANRALAGQGGSPVDHELTFETFIGGQSNALAHAAALRVADCQPGEALSFNPLFIHSAAGLGKTHLLNAIAARIGRVQPDRKVVYITAERFMQRFMAALNSKDTLSFKNEFQSVDVLLVDDFQFLKGPTMLQEFCHTFNNLLDAQRQIVVAADVPPTQLGNIDQRMRSRFAGGLVVDIEAPETELRRKLLGARLARAQRKDKALYIADEVLDFIAGRITKGGRELEGALNRVIASQQLTRAPVTLDLAALALRDMTQAVEPTRIRIEDIQKIVGQHYCVSKADLLSPRRARSIVRPRQIGMYLAKKMTSRSLPEIGRRFGGRDHSTVLHAVRKIDDLIQSDAHLAREVDMLGKIVEQG